MKVFIVDDNFEMIQAMTLALEGSGHTVQSSVAGATAIPQISSFKPDILLTDLVMAELNGLELCRELREVRNLQDLRIIFVSSKSEPYWQEQRRKQGPSDIFKSRSISKSSRHASKAWQTHRV